MESTTQQTNPTAIATVINTLTLNNPEAEELRAKRRREREETQRHLNMQEFQRILSKSCIPKRYKNKTFADFKITENNKTATTAINKPSDSYYIFGEYGTGKTFLSSLIGQEIIRTKLSSVLFTTATNLIFVLNPYRKETSENGEQKEPITRQQIYNSNLLIIDDIGVENTNTFNQSILFDIINHRYNENLQTIFTSNFNIIDLQKRLKSYEGGRIGRRITEMCKPLLLKKA